MVAPTTPYSSQLGDRDPIAAMRETAERVRRLTASWTPAHFEQSYAPGKWTARQILTHLAQTELAFGTRTRMALATPDYVAQPFDQDVWMAREASLSAREATDAFLALTGMNTALYASLSAAARQSPLTHPEYGALTVDWIIHQSAGHQIHHVKQLEQVGGL
jgi:DinB family protein